MVPPRSVHSASQQTNNNSSNNNNKEINLVLAKADSDSLLRLPMLSGRPVSGKGVSVNLLLLLAKLLSVPQALAPLDSLQLQLRHRVPVVSGLAGPHLSVLNSLNPPVSVHLDSPPIPLRTRTNLPLVELLLRLDNSPLPLNQLLSVHLPLQAHLVSNQHPLLVRLSDSNL